MKRIAKRLVRNVASSFTTSGPACLLYHRILPPEMIERSRFFSGLEVSTKDFETQISFISQSRIPLTLTEYVKGLSNHNLDPSAICVTFDDGYQDNLDYALPILEKYRVPATIFIAPKLLLNPRLAWWYELEHLLGFTSSIRIKSLSQQMYWDVKLNPQKCLSELNEILKCSTDDQIKDLMEQIRAQCSLRTAWMPPKMLDPSELKNLNCYSLFEFGAHTNSHLSLAALSDELALQEVVTGKSLLEELLGTEVNLFAYPFGGGSEAGLRDAQIVFKAGFNAAFTTNYGYGTGRIINSNNSIDDPESYKLFLLPRINVSGGESITDFLWKLDGVHFLWGQVVRKHLPMSYR